MSEGRVRPADPRVPAGSGSGSEVCRPAWGSGRVRVKKNISIDPHDPTLDPTRPSIWTGLFGGEKHHGLSTPIVLPVWGRCSFGACIKKVWVMQGVIIATIFFEDTKTFPKIFVWNNFHKWKLTSLQGN